MTAPTVSNPAPGLEVLDLDRLDAAVDAAIRAGEAGPLRVLGYGEITLVLGWPTERPELAVKRLPVFRDREALDRYAALVGRYVAALEERGVAIVPTVLRSAPTAGGALHAYIIQPLIRRTRLLDYVLRSAPPERGAVLLERLVDDVVGAVDDRIGLDAQVANWVAGGNELACLDVSTPLMRSAAGRDERHRPYPFLLPPPYHYGPPELPDEE